MKRTFSLLPSWGLPIYSVCALAVGCATALPGEDLDGNPENDPVVMDAGTTADDAGYANEENDSGPVPVADAGSETDGDAGKIDAGTEPPPPPPAALFEGDFSGSSNWNGQNRLWALVYRAPGASGHDHVVRSPNFSGSLSYRVGELGDCAVSVNVPVGALINDEENLRAEVGLADVSDDWGWNFGGGAATVRNNMLAENQLDATGHPNITFNSTGCRGGANASGTVLVDGNMTLKGVTRSVTWTVNINATEGRVTASGSVSILQSEFGITPYSFLGFKNDDQVDLAFEIVVTD